MKKVMLAVALSSVMMSAFAADTRLYWTGWVSPQAVCSMAIPGSTAVAYSANDHYVICRN